MPVRYRIMSLDGGGIRGSARVSRLLERIERARPGHSSIEWTCSPGTSTGAILALAARLRLAWQADRL